MKPRKKTNFPPSDYLTVTKQTREGMYFSQQFRKPGEGDPQEGQFTVGSNGRIYCPTKRGEKVFVAYLSRFYEQI